MRKIIRKLIKESLLKESNQREMVLSSGKVLPNFKNIIDSLISGLTHIKHAITVMHMIPSYSINTNKKPNIIKENDLLKGYNTYDVQIYIIDKEVGEVICKHIRSQKNYFSGILQSIPYSLTMPVYTSACSVYDPDYWDDDPEMLSIYFKFYEKRV